MIAPVWNTVLTRYKLGTNITQSCRLQKMCEQLRPGVYLALRRFGLQVSSIIGLDLFLFTKPKTQLFENY